MLVAQALFIGAVIGLAYAYVGYPLLLRMIGAVRRPRVVHRDGACQALTVVVAAHNEERDIGAKIENLLAQVSPTEKVRILVASDCSTDRTHEIVERYADRGVGLVVSPERRGKTAAENLALKEVETELVAFTDASTRLRPNALRNLLRPFADPRVGCVSSEDVSVASADGAGESQFVSYEMRLRRLETQIQSTVSASGSFYAARRDLCTPLPDHVTRDFAVPLLARERGLITVHEPEARCEVRATDDWQTEMRRKVRTITNGLGTLWPKRRLLNIVRYGWFAFFLWSHKLARWFVPLFAIIAVGTSICLATSSSLFVGVVVAEVLFSILAALGGVVAGRWRSAGLFGLPLFLLMTWWATLLAWRNFLMGRGAATWTPTRREPAARAR